MAGMTIAELFDYQRRLQAKYAQKWGEPISPALARSKLLWAYGELSEAADIIKKQGDDAIMEESETRRHFTEELGDAVMYLCDVMLCYGITEEDFERVYREKQATNINRWE